MTLGALPVVPAAERSAAGMGAAVVAACPEVAGAVVAGAVVAGAVVVGGVVVLAAVDEELQAARPTEAAASKPNDQVRKRGMRVPFGVGFGDRPDGSRHLR